jgi:hypothetical protein
MPDTYLKPGNSATVAQPPAHQRLTLRSAIVRLYSGSRWLTVTGFLMVADTALSLLGLALDPTIVTGAPVWLKPLKFAISTAIFTFTVAYILGCLRKTRRFAAVLGWFLAAALFLEIFLIDMQAARHTTSHFNYTTQFDAMVFAAMGIGILVVSLATALLLAAAFVERFPDPALGWAIRLSLLLALAGMSVGSLMVLPTPEQLAANPGHRMPHMGAHTVGAPDGGPGLPLTGWSADHGDLRIAHFLGLHAMQILLLGWFLVRRRANWQPRKQLRLIVTLAVALAGAFAVLLHQALAGQPLLRPDHITAQSWALCALVVIGFSLWTILTATHSKLMPMEGN